MQLPELAMSRLKIDGLQGCVTSDDVITLVPILRLRHSVRHSVADTHTPKVSSFSRS